LYKSIKLFVTNDSSSSSSSDSANSSDSSDSDSENKVKDFEKNVDVETKKFDNINDNYKSTTENLNRLLGLFSKVMVLIWIF
jgi:hypothetical protein